MTGVFILAVLILGGVQLVTAQIPSVCANNADLQSGRCCPNNCGGSARGECVDVSTMCKTDYSITGLPASFTNDGRFNWPSQIFSQICRCKGNHGGYDCSECKFGYKGEDCATKTMRVRKSIAAADFNWTEYHSQLNRAKTQNQTRYKVYTGGNKTDETNYKEVTVYHLFVWLHHHTTRTVADSYNASQSALDYAHESVGFLTWHRIYLLWFEREMQILLNNENFTVRYWDWTKQENRNILFVPDRLGESSSNGEVTGDLMSSWYLVCVDINGTAVRDTVCDPTTTPGNNRVIRCGINAQCSSSHWPDEASVKRALNDFENYRTTANPNIANKYDTMSFSNYFEGFAVDDECDVPESDRELLCGSDPVIRRRLHNLVHILLNGTMINSQIAVNDPLFINHHTMIDCLLEQWLTSHPNRQYPPTLQSQFAGHAGGDCIVPFIPLFNHSEVFSRSANDFGFSCDLRSFSSGAKVVTSLALVISMIVMSIAAITL